ncbi:MAG: LacI family DNA-binding transcriptional regulator [Opitutaceae bacterium]|jgi:LacI family transcriptional regulator
MAEITFCSIAKVALEAGVAKSTASLALRGSSRVEPETAARVMAVALRLGYRSDPRVGSLMARIRRAKAITYRERLAFVWLAASRQERAQDRFSSLVYAGAKQRTEDVGCALEEFLLDEEGMTSARLEKILVTRGITGVVFSSPVHAIKAAVRWDWSHFASVLIGSSEFEPELHRVAENHYHNMWMAVDGLRAAGCRRPVVAMFEPHHRRHHGVHRAAFMENHPMEPKRALEMLRFGFPKLKKDASAWLAKTKADGLVFGMNPPDEMIGWLRTLPQLKQIVTLDAPKKGVACMRVAPGLLAASAVDMVMAQLHRNERGLPEHPTTLLLDGVWWNA